ncbi:hypothetical protein F5Y12DRAFT_355805 [Xylaria sp. FL1777]|nr:hypothetical protein F5Y12DRAFT_355805 [Xylaria sp. FL1777]
MAPRKPRGQRRPAANSAETITQPGQSPQAPDNIAALEQSSQHGLKLDLPPITNVHQAFKDMLSKRRSEIIAVADKKGFELRVGTICSGTEAPIFALKLIKDISQLVTNGRKFIELNHLFSVENEPFKQAYISRNAPGSIIFRDVVDFADRNATAAPTILGDHCDIPRDIDLLVAGTSCVDFSTLNSQKRNSVQLTSKGAILTEEWKNSNRSDENRKSNLPLRENFFDDFREWLNGITPAQIQTTGKSIGESSVTFLSTVCYINNHRPKMVILENVNNAPWSSMCGLFLHAADYVATHVSVDTKDYYIPQTRNRGYVVAVDRQVFGSSAEQVVNEWKTQLSSLKRGASTPVQHWLLSPNDPLAMRARQDESEKAVANSLRSSKEVSWARSKMRHLRVRRQLKLGKGRPLTAWGLGGIDQPYDRIDRLVLRGQNNRALDCVDIYYLRCLHAGSEANTNDINDNTKVPNGPIQYDIKFKSQIFDLSQNIDRGHISRNFGITGCLTPRGLNLITDQGRLVSGFEALNLQGLPLRDLDLTRESQDELRDLAGNAMSTTVVGAALFSLLIAVHLHHNNVNSTPLRMITTKNQAIFPYQPLYRHSSVEPSQAWSNGLVPFGNVQEVIKISKRCRRYCYCNGGAKYSTDQLLCCKVCNITRCINCAGNPKHQFDHSWSIEDPITNDIAPQEMMEHFPTALTNLISNTIIHIPIRPDFQDPELQSWLLHSLRSVIFYYTQVLISETVTICYSAKDDKCSFNLQAVISDRAVTWYLFLDPWSPCGQLLSNKLGIPAAQMWRPFGRVRIYPSENDGFIPKQNSWDFWVFTETSFDVNITNLHPGSIEIQNTCRENLPDAIRDEIESSMGTYDHHPECDAAEDSLHVIRQDSKRYLFKDPTRIGPTQEDCYVISDECKLLEKHEFRDFCLRFLPEWTPRASGSQTKLLINGYWERAVTAPTQTQFVRYLRRAGSRLVPRNSELQVDREYHGVRTLASVCIDSNMLEERYITLLKYERVGPDNWAVLSRSDYSALFDLLAPVNVNLSGIESTNDVTTTESCKQCCPRLPNVHWMEKTTDGIKKSDRNIREPYRLSSEMRVYEKELRQSGEPFRVAVNIKDSRNKKGWKEVRANYEVNVDLLVHRAANHLPPPSNCSGEAPDVKTIIDIKKGSLNIPNLIFESFGKSLKSLQRSPKEESTAPKIEFMNGCSLTEQQLISLNWMLERELNPPPFTEREMEECRFDPLNLRILAAAERKIRCPGGILADDVGYGKTIISLALMQAQQNSDRMNCLSARNGNEGNTSALAASLVLAPKHLVDQWYNEAVKFNGWTTPDVVVFKTSRSLQGILNRVESNHTPPPSRAKRPKTAQTSTTVLEDLRAAKLIIVSTAVFDDNYYTWLGKYAGSLAHPRTIPRTKDVTNPNILGAFQDWYEEATTYARNHLSGFNPATFNLNRLEIIEQRQKHLQDSWKDVVADYYDASTRLGCQATQQDKAGEIIDGKEEDTVTGKEYSDTARANILTKEDFAANDFVYVLEAFSFARVIYDEFSYENFCVAQFVKNAKAHAKWVLSATPPTSNVKAVCDIGQLLGVHVARPVKLRPGLPLITEGPILLRQNPTEKQLSYGKLYTDQSVYERVEQAKNFLRHFASANPFGEGLGEVKVRESVICSHMTRFELAKYLDMQRDLRNFDLDVSKLLKHHQLDSQTINEFPAEGALRAGLALAYIASVDCTNDDNSDVDKLLLSRQRNLEEAQERLKYITNVAIWLVLRRFQEEGNKRNESATSFIEDFACYIESILEANGEFFDGAEGLKAVTDSINEEQFAECSQWLASIKPYERTSEAFYRDLFTRLGKQVPAAVWVNYFQLSPDRITGLEITEIYALIRELGGLDTGTDTLVQARMHLKELLLDKQPSAGISSQEPGNSRTKAAKARKGDDDGRPKYPRFQARKKTRGGNYTETESEITDIMLKLEEVKDEVLAAAKRLTTTSNLFCQDYPRKCNACGKPCSDLHFLPDCGHFICSKHREVRFCGQIESKHHPNGSGCPALIRGRSIPIQQIDRCELNITAEPAEAVQDKEPPKVSSKSWKITQTIDKILRQGDDKILVFYQFEKQKQEICLLLEHYGIDVPGPDERIRILKLNSEESAGSNLQDANHVMFVNTPVFRKQEEFEKYVKQAKGRAVRHGQKKEVHVYYFVTVNTFEVDLLQLRKRSSLRLEKEDVACLVDKKCSTDLEGNIDMVGRPHTSC